MIALEQFAMQTSQAGKQKGFKQGLLDMPPADA